MKIVAFSKMYPSEISIFSEAKFKPGDFTSVSRSNSGKLN